MKLNKNILLIAALAALIAAIMLMTGCNPVRRVLKSKEKTEQVVGEWRKANPLDTTKTEIIAGRDTFYATRIVKDSVRTPYPVNHRYKEIHYKESFRVDTLRIETRDTAMIGILIRKIEALEKKIDEQAATIKELRGFKTGVIFLGIVAVVIGIVALAKRFKIF